MCLCLQVYFDFHRIVLFNFCVYVILMCVVFFFKQKTAYEMRISDWSSDVCSSDLSRSAVRYSAAAATRAADAHPAVRIHPQFDNDARTEAREIDRKSVV